MATIELDGWQLVSGEARRSVHGETFRLPDRADRNALAPGDGAQLLFEIETREDGRVVDRGVDRLWVIVRKRVGDAYLGVLDSDPGRAEELSLQPGAEIRFGPEHVIAIERPPDGYVIEKYGPHFFEETQEPSRRFR